MVDSFNVLTVQTCSNCAYLDRQVVLTSNPPKYRCNCHRDKTVESYDTCTEWKPHEFTVPSWTITTSPAIVQRDYTPTGVVHKLKISKPYADAVLSGEKNFEIRENDRGYQKGDIVEFTEVLDKFGVARISHGLYGRQFRITYVFSGLGLKEGYCVFGIRPCEDAEYVRTD